MSTRRKPCRASLKWRTCWPRRRRRCSTSSRTPCYSRACWCAPAREAGRLRRCRAESKFNFSMCCWVGRRQQRVRQARHVARLNARLAYYEWRTQVLMSQQQQLAETRARLERVRVAPSQSMPGRLPLRQAPCPCVGDAIPPGRPCAERGAVGPRAAQGAHGTAPPGADRAGGGERAHPGALQGKVRQPLYAQSWRRHGKRSPVCWLVVCRGARTTASASPS